MTARARAELAARESEASFQRWVMDVAKTLGWRRVHIRAAKVGTRHVTPYEGDTGLPDIVLARGGRVLLIELKSAKGEWRPGQQEWLAAAGEHGHCFRPADRDLVLEVLR